MMRFVCIILSLSGICSITSCNQQPDFPKEDFRFLIGDWEHDNVMKDVKSSLHCEETTNGIRCIETTTSEKFIGYNFELEYLITLKNGEWLWYFDHSSRTRDKPVYTYKLRKMNPEEYFKGPEPGQVTFHGKAIENDKSDMQLVNYNGNRILITHSMLANGSIYVKKHNE